jgi:hypothetical protein
VKHIYYTSPGSPGAFFVPPLSLDASSFLVGFVCGFRSKDYSLSLHRNGRSAIAGFVGTAAAFCLLNN